MKWLHQLLMDRICKVHAKRSWGAIHGNCMYERWAVPCDSGGLQDQPRDNQREGGIIMAGPDSFGLPPRRMPGSILRRQVDLHSVEGAVSCGLQSKSQLL